MVLFGKKGSSGTSVNVTSSANGTNGFYVTDPYTLNYSTNTVADVNGDGVDDLLINHDYAVSVTTMLFGSKGGSHYCRPRSTA